MTGIGETLREARTRQGIDVSAVERETKIRAKYLRALENEEFDSLPGSTFVKSFLKTYAEFLGLDQQLLIEEYRAQHEPRQEADMPPFAPRPPAGRERDYSRRPPGRGTAIVVATVGLLAFLLILGVTGDEDGDGPASTDTVETEPRTETERRERPRAERPTRRRARRVSLRVAPEGATYVCIDDGEGARVFEGDLAEPRTFRGRRLRINLGNTSVALTVNGRSVPIKDGPDPVGFDFVPGERPVPLPEAERPCV